MATQEQIENSLHLQLSNDAPQRLQQTGNNWKQPSLGFYYGNTPHSEISVDIAIKASMLRVLQQENTVLPSNVWQGLSSLINTGTVVANAITIMTLGAAHAQPIP